MSAHPFLPFTEDRDTGPFFRAAAEGRLVYLRCDDCGHAVHPPIRHCPHCGGWNTAWRQASGEGVVRSWTTVVQAMHPGFPAPYTLAVVELADAPEVRLMTRLDGEIALHDGQAMTVWFEPLEGGGALPQWTTKGEREHAGLMTSFGIATYDYAPEDIMQLARHAERLGFDSLWCGEHYVIPERYEGHHPSRDETPKDRNDARDKAILSPDIRIFDPFSLLSAIAGATTRLKLGTAICIVPMNHPLLLARQIATIQAFSGGRFLFGTGAGWLKEEFDAVGAPFKERGARMDEMFEIIRKALAGGFFSHEGKYFQFGSVQVCPEPVKAPLVCGGNTGPALRRVAEIADAWINSAMLTADEAVALRATIVAAREACGTAARPFTYYVRPHTATPEEIDRFKAQGFENLVLWGPNLWPNTAELTLGEKVAGLEKVAKALRVGGG